MAKYFSESELACHCCGGMPENGIDPRLENLLDAMREAVCGPLVLSCAYRCPPHNREEGGVENSFHIQGKAADVQCPDGMSVEELASGLV